jgi:tetratricopeptide (TPR) repeat protein
MRAQGSIGEGKEEEGAEMLQKALSNHPGLLDAHQMLGDIALRAKDPETASQHFEQALAVDDRHRPSIFGLATSHRLLGQIDEALLGFRRVLDLAGEDSKATLAIADLEMERGDLAAAEKALAAAANDEATALIWNRLGEIQALDGRLDEALRSFATAMERNPDFSQPHFNLAVVHEDTGNLAGAREEYATAIDKAPKHYQAQFNLARLFGVQGDRDKERELLEASIASKPDFALGYFFLGKSLMDRNELQEAEEVTRAGLEIASENPLGWMVLADILNRSGRKAEAKVALDRGNALAKG